MTDTTERFTAWAMCPKCELVDCHRLREPRKRRQWEDSDDPVEQAYIKIEHMFERISWDIFDDDAAEVIRICKCGNEWGQA